MQAKLLIFIAVALIIPAPALCDTAISITYEASSARDPFVSALPKKIEVKIEPAIIAITKPMPLIKPKAIVIPPQLKLQGVIWNSSKPQAIINGEVMSLNDRLDDWQVHVIDQHGVTIVYQEEYFLYASDGSKAKLVSSSVETLEEVQTANNKPKEPLLIEPVFNESKKLIAPEGHVSLAERKTRVISNLQSVIPADRLREAIEKLKADLVPKPVEPIEPE